MDTGESAGGVRGTKVVRIDEPCESDAPAESGLNSSGASESDPSELRDLLPCNPNKSTPPPTGPLAAPTLAILSNVGSEPALCNAPGMSSSGASGADPISTSEGFLLARVP